MKIDQVNECKDLGVYLQTNIKFNRHYEFVVNKAYRLLGVVIQNTKHCNKITTIIHLYVLVSGQLEEHTSVIWAPHTKIHINTMKKAQKRFLRYLYLKEYNLSSHDLIIVC